MKDRSEYFKIYRKENRERNNQKQKERRKLQTSEQKESFKVKYKEYYEKNKYNISFRWQHAKKTATRRKKIFLLTLEEYSKIIENKCYYCDDYLKLHNETGSGLDRIDNTVGYVINNVVSCCGNCNLIRGNILTVEETKIAIAAVIKYRKGK